MDTPFFDAEALEALRKATRTDPEQVRLLRNALLKDFEPDAQGLARAAALAPLGLHPLVLEQRHDSKIDGASKLLFRTSSGLLTESVILRIATGRTTLCVSSQVGCAAACRFCATGTMGIARSLSAAEILDQVFQAGQLLATEGRRPRNVVFMGMGEPFHNEDVLVEVIERLTDPAWFNLSPKKILVSTVGITDGMLRFARRFPSVGLALSLHSVRDEPRQSIMPIAKRYPLPQLRETLVQVNALQNRAVMLEYLMLNGVNDTDADAAALIEWTEGLDVHLNLIPFNPVDGAALQGSTAQRCSAFSDLLKAAGRTTTLRHSLGRDIEAACGQLVKRENLARARQAGANTAQRKSNT
ncbi:MAG: 23S rRNA (adenine(2503)-C(2))-methyltransferase RlmN [Nannocystales bacterium]